MSLPTQNIVGFEQQGTILQEQLDTSQHYFLPPFSGSPPSQSDNFAYCDNLWYLSVHEFWIYKIAALLKDSSHVK